MKCLAFLQNQWFENPARMANILERVYKGDREKFIATSLFFRCRTGVVLRSVFGGELCEDIIWENASPKMGDNSKSKFPPDPDHIRGVIQKHDPQVIFGFGLQARDGLLACELFTTGRHVIFGPHPTARSPDVYPRLREMLSHYQSLTAEHAADTIAF